MRIVGLIVASIASCALAQDIYPPALCGTWNVKCLPQNGQFVTALWVFDGISVGTYIYTASFFNGDDTCTTNQTLQISHTGSFQDMGPAKIDVPETRLLMLIPGSSGFEVQAFTDAAATQLNTACPCGGEWSPNTARSLIQCSTSTCSDTSFIGGDNSQGNETGIVIGEALYGTTEVDSQSFIVSPFDSKKDVASEKLVPDPILPYSADPKLVCKDVVSSTDYCRTWYALCDTNTGPGFPTIRSFQRVFKYSGNSKDLRDAGYYDRQTTVFTTDNCAASEEFIYYEESGTFAFLEPDKDQTGAYNVERNAPGVTVTPKTPDAVAYLTTACPCYGTWKLNTPRRLTTCIKSVCPDTAWYEALEIAEEAYGKSLMWFNQQNYELMFTGFANNPDNGRAAFFDFEDVAYVSDTISTCERDDVSTAYCGQWALECSNGLAEYDISGLDLINGSPDANTGLGDGTLLRMINIFDGGFGCASQHSVLSMVANGFWSTNSQGPTLGVLNFLVNFPTLLVTAKSTAYVAELNALCPCGGTWVRGVERVLTTCPVDTCVGAGIFQGAVLGQPGFGNILRTGQELRMTPFSTNETEGYLSRFGVDDLPYTNTGECPPNPPVSYSFCGEFVQPCRSDVFENPPLDYTAEFDFSVVTGAYTLEHKTFLAGSGCDGTEAFAIEQQGVMEFKPHEAVAIQGAIAAVRRVSKLKVTVLLASALQLIQELCPCNGVWVLGQARYLSNCPNSCENWSDFLGQPVVPVVYGVALRQGDQIRFTMFNNTTDAYQYQFSVTDFPYALESNGDGLCAATASSQRLSGGGVVLIVAFVIALVYFAGGAAYNFTKSGTPEILHADFWKGLPSLVADGFTFTFTRACGLRGSGPVYADISSSKGAGSYGSV